MKRATDDNAKSRVREVTSDDGQELHFQKYLRESDEDLSRQLAERYGGVASQQRLEAMLSTPTEFEDREQFDRSLVDAGGTADAGTRMVGFSRFACEPTHVATDHLEIPKTIAHERLHQISDPKARGGLGKSLYEGVTEDLAVDTIGSESDRARARDYGVERAVAHEMRDIAGDDAVERAYFSGDTDDLRRRLDERLGAGGLERLQREIEDLA